jgi:signal peptidase II
MILAKRLRDINFRIFQKQNIFSLIIIIFIFSIDRISKIRILENLSENNFYVNEYVNLNLIWNTGIGFGLLSWDNSIVYNFITTIIGLVIVILLYFLLISKKFDRISLSLIIGGALGNFYDRISFKAVPDFIDIHYGNFHWFTFNCADIFITVGIIFFLLGDLKK